MSVKTVATRHFMRVVAVGQTGYCDRKNEKVFSLHGPHGLRERLFFISWFLRDFNHGNHRIATYNPVTDTWHHKNGGIKVSREGNESLHIIQSMHYDLLGILGREGSICFDRRIYPI